MNLGFSKNPRWPNEGGHETPPWCGCWTSCKIKGTNSSCFILPTRFGNLAAGCRLVKLVETKIKCTPEDIVMSSHLDIQNHYKQQSVLRSTPTSTTWHQAQTICRRWAFPYKWWLLYWLWGEIILSSEWKGIEQKRFWIFLKCVQE